MKTILEGEVGFYLKRIKKYTGKNINQLIKDFLSDIHKDYNFFIFVCRKILFFVDCIERTYPDYLENFTSFNNYYTVTLNDEDIKMIRKIYEIVSLREGLISRSSGTGFMCKGILRLIVTYMYVKYFKRELLDEWKKDYEKYVSIYVN